MWSICYKTVCGVCRTIFFFSISMWFTTQFNYFRSRSRSLRRRRGRRRSRSRSSTYRSYGSHRYGPKHPLNNLLSPQWVPVGKCFQLRGDHREKKPRSVGGFRAVLFILHFSLVKEFFIHKKREKSLRELKWMGSRSNKVIKTFVYKLSQMVVFCKRKPSVMLK